MPRETSIEGLDEVQQVARKKVIFEIDPQTHVRATQGDRILFRIPRVKLRPASLKRLERLERYNDYKVDLRLLAQAKGFNPPEQGGHLIFYIPVPKSWKEYKKHEMHMKLHQSTPDWDNLSKAFFDSILDEDKYIADVRVTKRWINNEHGRIEFLYFLPEYPSKDVLI
jgi:Holliday junction resolvase RusA-like endonuclease